METRDKLGRFVKGVKRGPQSKEIKDKISRANSGSRNGMWRTGKPHCKECGIEIWWGSVHCRKHVKRDWLVTKDAIRKSAEARKIIYQDETKHPRWKGQGAGYISIHIWVNKHLGKPSFCEVCSREDSKKYEWANIDGKYKRNLNDWVRLCTRCHHKYDNISKKIWITRRQLS